MSVRTIGGAPWREPSWPWTRPLRTTRAPRASTSHPARPRPASRASRRGEPDHRERGRVRRRDHTDRPREPARGEGTRRAEPAPRVTIDLAGMGLRDSLRWIGGSVGMRITLSASVIEVAEDLPLYPSARTCSAAPPNSTASRFATTQPGLRPCSVDPRRHRVRDPGPRPRGCRAVRRDRRGVSPGPTSSPTLWRPVSSSGAPTSGTTLLSASTRWR